MTRIQTIRLAWSNTHLILDDRAVLFDAGSPGDERSILRALEQAGIRSGDLALIVLGHGHADHAGAAAALRERTGAPIALGRPDIGLVRAGRSGRLVPRGLEARLIRPLVPTAFPAFEPDLIIDDALDLRPHGVTGSLRTVPGHTPGSLAALLPDGDVLAGDVLRGGRMGGRLGPGRPLGHYFQADGAAAMSATRALLEGGARRFHLGHGGPVESSAVAVWLANR